MRKQDKTGKPKKKHSVSVKQVFLPFVVVILLLNIAIVANSFLINRMGESVTQATEQMFTYSRLSGDYFRGVIGMAEKAMSCIRSGNEMAVKTYLGQVAGVEGLGKSLYTSMDQKGFDDAAEKMAAAMDLVQEQIGTEQYAMRLAAETWEKALPEDPPLLEAELEEEDLALSDEEKIEKAEAMLTDQAYLTKQGIIERELTIAVNMATEDTKNNIREESKILSRSRLLQGILTIFVPVALIVMYLLMYLLLIRPLAKGVTLVQQGSMVPEDDGFAELQRLASSYNELLSSRNSLEETLMKQSHTDALTGLPNRLALQEYIEELESKAQDTAVTVFSMDVNWLKETNDTKGHTYGDMLLRNASDCIRTVFDDGTGRNCFRFGGDEFAAFWKGASGEDILKAMEKFREEQEWRRISISVGYEHVQHLQGTTIRDMFKAADARMYENKAETKKISDVLPGNMEETQH